MTVYMVIVLQMPITINTKGLSVGTNSLYVTFQSGLSRLPN